MIVRLSRRVRRSAPKEADTNRQVGEGPPSSWAVAAGRDASAVGLVTRLGPVDVVLAPKGYEAGYAALVPGATSVRRNDVEIRVAAIEDVVHSKELLRRDKDVEHLALLYQQRPDLAPGAVDVHGPNVDLDGGLDLGP